MMPFLMLAAGALVLVLAGYFLLAFRARRRTELRGDLLELLAAATARGLPLAPLLGRAVAEYRGSQRRQLERLTADLGRGSGLGDALGAATSHAFPPEQLNAIRSAEGTAELPAVLEGLAGDCSRGESAHQRFSLALLYPTLLGAVLLITLSTCRWIEAAFGMRGLALEPVHRVGLLLLAGGCVGSFAWLAGWPPPLMRWLRGVLLGTAARLAPFTALPAAARFLRTCAAQLRAGVPLPEAVRRSGATVGHRRAERAARQAAAAMESGAPAAEGWSAAPLPAFAATRIAAASAGPAERLAEALDRLAVESEERFENRLTRFLTLLTPAWMVFFATLLALQFAELIELESSYLQETLPW